MICPKCGYQNDDSFAYCQRCGEFIGAQQQYDNYSNKTVVLNDYQNTNENGTQNSYSPQPNNIYQQQPPQKKKNNGLIIALCIVAAVLVLIISVALIVHFTHNSSKTDDTYDYITQQYDDDTTNDVDESSTDATTESTTKKKETTTKAKKVTEDKNLVPNMSASERSNINTFISNFAEVEFTSFNKYDTYDDADIINFSMRHNYANDNGGIKVKNGEVTLDADVVAKNAKRFFNVSISHQSTDLADYDYDNDCYYSDIYTLDLDNGSSKITYKHYYSMAVVDSMVSNGDGTYDVQFTVYKKDDGALSKKYYNYTPSQAHSSSAVYEVGEGTAVVKDYKDGKYQLVKYDVNYN